MSTPDSPLSDLQDDVEAQEVRRETSSCFRSDADAVILENTCESNINGSNKSKWFD